MTQPTFNPAATAPEVKPVRPSQIRPMGNRLLLDVHEPLKTTPSGLHLPRRGRHRKPRVGGGVRAEVVQGN